LIGGMKRPTRPLFPYYHIFTKCRDRPIVLVNNFLAFLGIGLNVPIVPTIMNDMQISGSVVGYMFAAFAASQFVSSPLTGRAVDRIGRKPVLILGLVLFGASPFLFGMATIPLLSSSSCPLICDFRGVIQLVPGSQARLHAQGYCHSHCGQRDHGRLCPVFSVSSF